MANIKSAEKRIRQTAAKKRARNKARVSRLRSAVKKYGAGRRQGARPRPLPATHSEIDRARAKGVIHRNAAARYKSRLAKKAAAEVARPRDAHASLPESQAESRRRDSTGRTPRD